MNAGSCVKDELHLSYLCNYNDLKSAVSHALFSVGYNLLIRSLFFCQATHTLVRWSYCLF